MKQKNQLRHRLTSMMVGASLLMGVIGGNVPAQTAQAADTTNGLVAHWTFDGNATESVHGLSTEAGAKPCTYVDGIFGQAASFNGKDNYLVVANDDVLNLGNSVTENNDCFTISAWIYLQDVKRDDMMLLDKGNETGWDLNDDCLYSNPYRAGFNNAQPYLTLSNVYINNPADIDLSGSETCAYKSVEAKEWFLLTYTYDGSKIKIYKDNQLINQTNYADGIAFNLDCMYIGVDHYLEQFYKGLLDDLRLYTRTLSYDDVNALYQAGVASNKEALEPKKQVVAYYSFDGNVKDSSVFKNDAAIVSVGGTSKYVIGKNGKAITIGKGNYIEVPANDCLNFDTDFTISFWMKSATDQDAPLLYRQNPAHGPLDNENDYAYKIQMSSWSESTCTNITCTTQGLNADSWCGNYNSSLNNEFFYSEQKVKSNSWFHVTFTYTYDEENVTGEFKTYLNGVLRKKTDEIPYPNIINAAGSLLIGYDGDTFYQGSLDELRIYNECLNATAVKKEYQRVDSIYLSKANAAKLTMKKGTSVALTTILLKDIDRNKYVSLKSSSSLITFKSSNSKVFSVTSSGKITAKKAGKAYLTITYGGLSKTYKVTIK